MARSELSGGPVKHPTSPNPVDEESPSKKLKTQHHDTPQTPPSQHMGALGQLGPPINLNMAQPRTRDPPSNDAVTQLVSIVGNSIETQKYTRQEVRDTLVEMLVSFGFESTDTAEDIVRVTAECIKKFDDSIPRTQEQPDVLRTPSHARLNSSIIRDIMTIGTPPPAPKFNPKKVRSNSAPPTPDAKPGLRIVRLEDISKLGTSTHNDKSPDVQSWDEEDGYTTTDLSDIISDTSSEDTDDSDAEERKQEDDEQNGTCPSPSSAVPLYL